YQWRFNGANIAGATSSKLVVSNAQPAKAGNYDVMVSNPAGSIASAVVVLKVAAEKLGDWVNGNRGFVFNLPGYYQHQQYGLTKNGLLDRWEFDPDPKDPNDGSAGGWCRQTMFLDLIYFWKLKNVGGANPTPYDDILVNANGDFTKDSEWLGAVNDELPKLF